MIGNVGRLSARPDDVRSDSNEPTVPVSELIGIAPETSLIICVTATELAMKLTKGTATGISASVVIPHLSIRPRDKSD